MRYTFLLAGWTLALYSSSQSLLWSLCWDTQTGANILAMDFNTTDELFAGGVFGGGTIDIDPGTGQFLLSSTDNADAFLFKYAADGSVLWGHVFGDSTSSSITALYPDDQGGVYVAGNYSWGTFDVDPGPSVLALSPNGTVNNAFIAHFDSLGELDWAFDLGAPWAYLFPSDLKLDGSGNIFLTGSFGTGNNAGIDMDPGPGVSELFSFDQTDGNAFLAKYSGNGIYHWSFRIGGSANFEGAQGVAVDTNGNATIAGIIESVDVDLDPGPGQFLVHAPNGRQHLFLASYQPDGTFRWGGAAGSGLTGSGSGIYNLTGTTDGGVVATGFLIGGDVDMDLGPGQWLVSDTAAFVIKYTALGELEWFVPLSGSGNYGGEGLSLDRSASDEIVGVGRFLADSLQIGIGGPWIHRTGTYGGYAARFGSDGTLLDAFAMNSTELTQAYRVAAADNGDAMISGIFLGQGLDLDPNGTLPSCTATGTIADGFLARYGDLSTALGHDRDPLLFSLFPVPVAAGQGVQVEGPTEPFLWRVTDLMGKELYRGHANGPTTLPTGALSPGAYLVQLESRFRSSRAMRMVVLWK
ncbi:MAG: hypothetical protein KDB88_13440 [Flavobacteriales bacterium]|nr:hypothetical protein [Flavobacteriales bacterium]